MRTVSTRCQMLQVRTVILLRFAGHRPDLMLYSPSIRCGVSVAPAACTQRQSGAALCSHQGEVGGAAAGRRSSGGFPGPDKHHPQGPAGCLRSPQRHSAHAHSGQENKTTERSKNTKDFKLMQIKFNWKCLINLKVFRKLG